MEIGKKVGVNINFAIQHIPVTLKSFEYSGMTKNELRTNYYTGGFHAVNITVEKVFEDYAMLRDLPLDVMNALGLQLKDLLSFSFYITEE